MVLLRETHLQSQDAISRINRLIAFRQIGGPRKVVEATQIMEITELFGTKIEYHIVMYLESPIN
jgi:hypothetical protein